MYTRPAARSLPAAQQYGADVVTTLSHLLHQGWTGNQVRSQLAARRWQRIGRAIVRHNGPPSRTQLRRAALITLGPRALLTSLTALEAAGLTGWERPEIHVLVPRGARVRRAEQLPLRLHYTDRWSELSGRGRGDRDDLAHAVCAAAAGQSAARSACAIVAASVQQRLLRSG